MVQITYQIMNHELLKINEIKALIRQRELEGEANLK